MNDEIITRFSALSSRARITILARTIHYETVYVRDYYQNNPTDLERLYLASEFIHRLSGSLLSIVNEPSETKSERYVALLLVEGVAQKGEAYLRMLADWIIEAEAIR